jgi:hypothetical protein
VLLARVRVIGSRGMRLVCGWTHVRDMKECFRSSTGVRVRGWSVCVRLRDGDSEGQLLVEYWWLCADELWSV